MSPIADIQARFRELGRIRLGAKELTGGTVKSGPRKGQPAEKPVKLSNFRLTSPWGHLIEQAAAVFGGTPREWDNAGAKEFEVLTELVDAHGVAYLPVVIPPGDVFSQWYELWDGGGLIRRCDGLAQVAPTPCECACPADPNERNELASKGKACKPTSRLSVMLPDVADLGIWRLESHGFHAATELAAGAEIFAMATRHGAMISADLRLQEREATRRPGEPIRTFYVPAVSFRHTLASLGVLEAGTRPAAALTAGAPTPTAGGRRGEAWGDWFTDNGWSTKQEHDEYRREISAILKRATPKGRADWREWLEGNGILADAAHTTGQAAAVRSHIHGVVGELVPVEEDVGDAEIVPDPPSPKLSVIDELYARVERRMATLTEQERGRMCTDLEPAGIDPNKRIAELPQDQVHVIDAWLDQLEAPL